MQPSRRKLPRIWLPEIVHCIAQFLDANEVSCTLRLLDKATANQFANRTVVRLLQPVPQHAFCEKWDDDQTMRSYTIKKRHEFVALTAASGCLPNLELAVQRAGIDLTTHTEQDPLLAAAAAGHIHICERLRERGCRMDISHLAAASRAGQQEACAWLLNSGCHWDSGAVCAAARGRHPALMDWLLAQCPHRLCDMRHDLIVAVAEGCDIATFRRLCRGWPSERMSFLRTRVFNSALASAASSPTPDWQDKVQWLEAQGATHEEKAAACLMAAQCPDSLERLTWLRGRGYPVDMGVVMAAAERGNLAVMIMLLDGGVAQSYPSAEKVAEKGQLAALKLLHDRRCLLRESKVLVNALQHGHLEVVDWLVQELGAGVELERFLRMDGCRLVNRAAQEGSVVVLEWLHERGCRGARDVFYWAAKGGCEEVIEWLLAHGYRFQPAQAANFHYPYLPACENGDLATLACLNRLGCDWVGRKTVRKTLSFPRLIKVPYPGPGVWAWIARMLEGEDGRWEDSEDDEE